ncbi:MAG: tripartite tricarboxylate transporter permease [Alphaproteobacteria bacterium]|nr:tripartite tricarboxylate transporter permease [Alphaproteobacteria bacterium]
MTENIIEGLSLIFQWEILLVAFLGVTAGVILGAIPGMSDIPAISLMLPFTFYMHPVMAISMLMGLSKGANMGGSFPAILFNMPGTSQSVVTCFDGYPLTRKGQAGKALKMAVYASTMADTMSDLVLILAAAAVASIAIMIGPPEFAMIVVFSLVIIGVAGAEQMVKGLIAICLGLLLTVVGFDPMSGIERMTFGSLNLSSGFGIVPMVLGLFVVSEVIRQTENMVRSRQRNRKVAVEASAVSNDPDDHRVTKEDFRRCLPAIFGGFGIGAAIGAIPGIGSGVAAYLSYMWAKKSSKTPERFGHGALEGVAAAEAGNNAVVGPNLIPLLTLGVPGNLVAALILGAFMMQGLRPGPLFMSTNAPMIYALFGVLLISNVFTFVVGSIFVRYARRVTRVPEKILYPCVLVVTVVGCYVYRNNMFDVMMLAPFGIAGYVLVKLRIPVAPLLIAFILGNMLEERIRQSLQMSGGDFTIFVTRPIALLFFVLSVVTIVLFVRRRRRVILPREDI